jgi:hypothetical protein
MKGMGDQLRGLYDYASQHKVYSLHLLLRAADHIDRLEAQVRDLRADLAALEDTANRRTR